MPAVARLTTLRGMAVGALVVTLVLGTISNLLFLAAFEFRLDLLADPAQMVAIRHGSAGLLRWAAVTDLFSYYLPIAVVALALWQALRPLGARLADGATLAALGYVLAGGAAAAALAMAGAPLLDGPARGAASVTYAVLVEVVFHGIWQLLGVVLVAVWWLGIGTLVRPAQPRFARLSVTLGGIALLVAALNVLGVGVARDVALGLMFVLLTVWLVWLALLLNRRAPPFAQAP